MKSPLNAGDPPTLKVLWSRGLLNGLVALFLAFVLYTIPAMVVATRMAMTLGPKLRDNGAVSTQISAAIAGMYGNNLYLVAGLAVALAGLVFWRARVISRIAGSRSVATGAVVGAVPAIAGIVPLTLGIGGPGNIAAVVLFVLAGMAGGARSGRGVATS
jgi:hypothetical protein